EAPAGKLKPSPTFLRSNWANPKRSTTEVIMKTATILVLALLSSALLFSCSPSSSQHADSSFDTRVARPAYAPSKGPRVVIDAAHQNFHTASGRYEPFAQLLSHDGYRVSSGTGRFTAESLRGWDVLVVSNAHGEGDREVGPAFSPSEVQEVRDWVRSGGSLLLIADHWPFGGAAASLSSDFGVDMSQGIVEDSVNCAPSTADPGKMESTTLVFS